MNRNPETPVACLIAGVETRQQRRALLQELLREVQETKQLRNGYALRFPKETFKRVTEFIEGERACCPFLDFAVEINSSKATLWLKLTGPKAAKQFLQTELGLPPSSTYGKFTTAASLAVLAVLCCMPLTAVALGVLGLGAYVGYTELLGAILLAGAAALIGYTLYKKRKSPGACGPGC